MEEETTRKFITPEYTRRANKKYREKNKAILSEKKKLASQDPEFREKRKIYMRQYMAIYRKKKTDATIEKPTITN